MAIQRDLYDFHLDNIIKEVKKIYTRDYVLITRKLNHKSDNVMHQLPK